MVMLYFIDIPEPFTTIAMCALISLMITAIYSSMLTGAIFSFVQVAIANALDWMIGQRWSTIVQKPLMSCLPCMASVWTIVITLEIDIVKILVVCGINVIIESAIISRDE